MTSNFIDNEEKSYQEQLISFKNAYPLYDNETINDLATGQLLRKQFLNFKGMHGVDFSPALLPALVMLERVMRGYYVKKVTCTIKQLRALGSKSAMMLKNMNIIGDQVSEMNYSI